MEKGGISPFLDGLNRICTRTCVLAHALLYTTSFTHLDRTFLSVDRP